MPFIDRYPQFDAHGVPYDRVTLLRLNEGSEQIGIDDGYEMIEGRPTLHVQAAQLADLLAKKIKHPATGEPVPCFVVKDHVFKPRPSVPNGPPISTAHPLASVGVRYDPKVHDPIIQAFKAAAAERAKRVVPFAEAQAKPFAAAAKKAAGKGAADE